MDDQPVANPDKIVLGSVGESFGDSGVNLVLILDRSGSMGSGGRMDLMKDAVKNLIESYDGALEGVMVAPFDDGATVFKDDGSIWLDPADAIDHVNSLTLGGGTYYDTAISKVMSEWTEPSEG